MAANWTNGGPNAFRAHVEAESKEMGIVAQAIVRKAAHNGAQKMQQFILDAHTKTGDARVARGGAQAGRYESGFMFNEVSSHVEVLPDGLYRGTFGWDAAQAYFLQQEYGYGPIEAMHALLQAFLEIREEFLQDVLSAKRNGGIPT